LNNSSLVEECLNFFHNHCIRSTLDGNPRDRRTGRQGRIALEFQSVTGPDYRQNPRIVCYSFPGLVKLQKASTYWKVYRSEEAGPEWRRRKVVISERDAWRPYLERDREKVWMSPWAQEQ
jgi:hypothetical protein